MFKHTLSFVASATLVVSLGADTLSLEPIVVSAIKAEQSLKNTTSNIQIITGDELEEKYITTVIEALRTLGNIPIIQSGGIGQQSSLFLHGFKQGNTLVLIDGIRYNDPTTTEGQAQLEHLMINNIERIEILNGAQSGVWGANAVAGLINIITKKPTHKLQLSSNFEYGSYDTSKLGLSASQKINQLSYYLGINQITSAGISASTPQDQSSDNYEKDSYRNQTINAKLFYDLSEHDTLSTQFNFIDAKTEYDPYDTPNGSDRETSQINRLGNLAYHHQFNPDNSIDINYAITKFSKTDPHGYTKVFKGNNHELSTQGEYHYTKNGFIVAGINTLDSKDTISTKELDSEGIFLTNTNRFDDLILTESIRYDAYNTFNDKTTGKVGGKYFISNEIALSANYGTAYRVPSLYELYADYYGNPNLQPETTQSFDSTMQYKEITFTYYNNLINNLVGFHPTTYINEQSIGKSRIKGYEVRYSNTFAEKLSLDLSYTKLSAKNQEGKYLNRRPFTSAMGSITYYTTSRFSVGTTLNYIGTRYDDLAQTKQTGRYTLTGASLNYDLNPEVKLYLKGENLTDKRYQEAATYGTAGRSVYAGLNAKF